MRQKAQEWVNFRRRRKEGEPSPGVRPFYVVYNERRTTQRLSQTLRGSFGMLYESDNPSVSYADSSLYTREPLGVSSKEAIMQNLEASPV